MRLAFAKMHGLGNDFVVIDASGGALELDPDRIRALADRRQGIGFDQMLVVAPAQGAQADFRYRIYNADGDEVEHCGNGARCFARFVRERGLAAGDTVRLETSNGLISVRHLSDDRYRVDMGEPRLEPDEIPFEAPRRELAYLLDIDGETHPLAAVSMGNPHAVLTVDDVESAPVATLGPAIEIHPRFPQRVNVGFMQVADRGRLAVRVWERGVGETRACGTGACAAVVAARLQQLVDAEVRVQLTGGELEIAWPGEGHALSMTGPANWVFDGTIDLRDN